MCYGLCINKTPTLGMLGGEPSQPSYYCALMSHKLCTKSEQATTGGTQEDAVREVVNAIWPYEIHEDELIESERVQK